MTREPDDLIARLRAADPAAALDSAPAPDRAALLRARSARSGGRLPRIGAGATVLAVAGTLAFAVGPGGGGGVTAALPTVPEVLAQALDATRPASGSIVAYTSSIEVRAVVQGTPTAFTEEISNWVRYGDGGKPVAIRRLMTEAEGAGLVAGSDEAYAEEAGGPVKRVFDPKAGKVVSREGLIGASVLLDARRLLQRAQDGDRLVKMRQTTLDGRDAWLLTFSGVEEPALRGDRNELVVDASTYEPLLLRKHSEGLDVEGRAFTNDFSERIESIRRLPDNAENRRLLEVRGPVG